MGRAHELGMVTRPEKTKETYPGDPAPDCASPTLAATTPGDRGSSPAPRLHRPPSSSPSLAGPPPPRLRSPLVAGLSPAAAGASRLWGHRTRLHPLDRAPPPPAAGLTPRLSPLGPGELAVERRGRATAGESCSSSSPSPLADPSVLISTAGEKTHKLCYGGWFIRTRIFFLFSTRIGAFLPITRPIGVSASAIGRN